MKDRINDFIDLTKRHNIGCERISYHVDSFQVPNEAPVVLNRILTAAQLLMLFNKFPEVTFHVFLEA